VEQSVHTALGAWEAFYIIVGSVAGALTGLQFVVMAMVGERRGASSPEIAAFGTPTVLHFCAALLVSALLSAPWTSLFAVAAALGIAGFSGVVYALIVIRRARRQTGYRPQLEDWIWHAALPLLAYAALAGAAVGLPRFVLAALSLIAGASLMLVFIGIHNAWDTITYVAVDLPREAEGKGREAKKRR
jgi:hypothetical protein